jgi:hypothetical protein
VAHEVVKRRKIADAADLARWSRQARSLTHRDAAAFDADTRIGAVLLDSAGRVIAQRCANPTRSIAARSLVRPDLPAGHPRGREDGRSATAVLRDLIDPWGSDGDCDRYGGGH